MSDAEPWSVEEIFDPKRFVEKTVRQPKWMKDGVRLSWVADYPGTDQPTVWIGDSRSGETAPLLDPRTLRLPGEDEPRKVHSFEWSPDERLMLIPTEAPARFKPCGDLLVYDLEAGVLRRLTRSAEPLWHPKFSPDGRWIGLVRGSDLWLLDLQGGERRLTWNGTDCLYNGRLGWVYEEELGLGDGWRWSPDSRRIALFQQDESAVPEVLLPDYGDIHQSPRRTRYPKAGDPNPRTLLGILSVATGNVRWLDLGDPGSHYLACAQWTPDGRRLLVQRLPRSQDRLDLLAVDADTGQVRLVLTESDAAWVRHRGDLKLLGPDRFVWESEESGFRHLSLYDLEGRRLRTLTEGAWEVDAVVGTDPVQGRVWFTAARPDAAERRLCSVDLAGGPVREWDPSSGCQRALFNEQGTHWLHTRSTWDRPPIQHLRSVDGPPHPLVEDSLPDLRDTRLLPWERLRIPTPAGGLMARLLRPPTVPPGGCPAILHTYAGPESQVVRNVWGGRRALWHQHLAHLGFAILMADGRGTAGRGREWSRALNRRLGGPEIEDQIAAARWLAAQPWVDPHRIAVKGWSYGGFAALLCLLRAPDLFQAGVSIAPVTDYRLYDTIYTERYLGLPSENEEAYREGAPLTHAADLQGRLLLIHGLMDDNVHFQHAALFAEKLQEAGRPFETMFYTGQGHGLDDRHAHLYAHITGFLLRALGSDAEPAAP